MLKIKGILLVGLLTLTGCASGPRITVWEPKGPGGPRVELRTTPSFLAQAPLVGGALFTVDVSVKNSDEEVYCPEIVVMWPNDTVSSNGADCPPFNEVDPKQRDLWCEFSTSNRFGAGSWIIQVELRKSGRVLTRLIRNIVVTGS